VIILASGHTIYNASTKNKDITQFFEQIDVSFGKYSNPSDSLLKLANAPKKLNEDLTIPGLESICMRDNLALSQHANDNFASNIRDMNKRQTNFCKQLFYLMKRNILY